MTEEKRNHSSDEELLALLERSPQEGMEELFRCYAGLAWSVAEKHLDNQEDIKECVNDTFMEFYLHRERFHPEKGELKTWLAAIARHLAVSRFRKNAASDEEELREDTVLEQDPFDNIEKKMDLEQAIEAMPREDTEVIRMKYYNGMTVQEIASSLGLPFETVKKRHQRSLKKLKRMLIMGIVMGLLTAMLAACAYLALRYFGVIPGYGVVTDPEEKAYVMAEPVSVEGEYGTYTVTEAKLLNGTVTIWVDVTFRNEELCAEAKALEREGKYPFFQDMTVTSGGQTVTIFGFGKNSAEFDNPPPPQAMLTWHMIYNAEDVLPPGDDVLVLHYAGMEIAIPMEPVAAQDMERYGSAFHEYGGLLAVPGREEGSFRIELYPLNTGKYEIAPSVIRGYYMEGKTGDILLIGEDGREYVGEQIYPNGPASFSTWDFGEVEAGVYTLHIPYVFLTKEIKREESHRVLINSESGPWGEPCELPCGTVSMVSMEALAREELPDYAVQSGMDDMDYLWRCVLRWEPPEDGMDMYYLPVSLNEADPDGNMVHEGISAAPEPLPDHCCEVIYGVRYQEKKDVDAIEIELHSGNLTQSFRWDCEYEIPVVVE